MNIFEKKFAMLLEQPEPPMPVEEPPAPVGPVGPEDDTLTSPDIVDDVGDNPGVNWRQNKNSEQRSTLEGWIVQLSSFTEFLNSSKDSSSMQRQLADADCDTLFNDVSNAQAQKIARVAEDLASLGQQLEFYITKAESE